MSSPILSAAFISFQLVISAYEQVKSNKERCRNLVERCELLVSRLSYIVDQRGEDVEGARIERLQEAFQHIIQTVTRVGTRGWFKMVIYAESDTLAIDGCHHRISDLITLLNLHDLIDVARWHEENLDARQKDQEELLQALKQIETGNKAISRQLRQQGSTLAEIWRSLNKPFLKVDLVPPSPCTSDSVFGFTSDYDDVEVLTPTSPLTMWQTVDSSFPSESARMQPPGTIPIIKPFRKRSRRTSTASIISTKDTDSYHDPDNVPSSSHAPRQRRISWPPHEFSYVPPSSDVSMSQVSNKADRSSESPTQSECGQWNPPVLGLSVGGTVLELPRGTDHIAKPDAESTRDDSRTYMDLDGVGTLNAEVLLVANVPDSGFLLDHADVIGSTSLSVLRDWTDAGRFVSQIIRFEGHNILLRTSPATNPYLILRSSSPLQPPPTLPPSSVTTPQSPTLTLVERRVFLTCSAEPVTLVLLFYQHSIVHRAVFVWPASITVREMKADLSNLINKASDYTSLPLSHKYSKAVINTISVLSGMLIETDSLDDGMALGQCGATFASTGLGNDVDNVVQGAYLCAGVGYVLDL